MCMIADGKQQTSVLHNRDHHGMSVCCHLRAAPSCLALCSLGLATAAWELAIGQPQYWGLSKGNTNGTYHSEPIGLAIFSTVARYCVPAQTFLLYPTSFFSSATGLTWTDKMFWGHSEDLHHLPGIVQKKSTEVTVPMQFLYKAANSPAGCMMKQFSWSPSS